MAAFIRKAYERTLEVMKQLSNKFSEVFVEIIYRHSHGNHLN